MRCHSVGCGMASKTQSVAPSDYAKHRSRSQCAEIRLFDDTGNVIETDEHAGNFKEP
jgi:hypothetical protein